MSSIPQVAEAMQTILTRRAEELAEETGFVQRSTAQLDGPIFTQMTVFAWMFNPAASYSQLRHVAASLGVAVSNQAIEQRFGPASSELLKRVLAEAVGEVISSEASAPEILSRFNGIYLQDGTVIGLPSSLAQQWQGCGGSTPQAGQSSLRLQARLDLASGQLQGPWLQSGRESELRGPAQSLPLPKGALRNVDMGYFSIPEMRQQGEEGLFWLCPAKAGAALHRSARTVL